MVDKMVYFENERLREEIKKRDKEIAKLKDELAVLKQYFKSLNIGTCSEKKQGVE